MNNAPIGVFDSGVGGISTLRSCMDLLPDESFVYLADRSGLPYGSKEMSQIETRVKTCVQTLMGEGVKAVVVACNTATNVGIGVLRSSYSMPFVGVEPALKPAVEQCRRGNILLLLTTATQQQEKFRKLFQKYDNGRIIISPQPDLAFEIENNIENIEPLRRRVYSILQGYKNVEGVVLGCTHYIFLQPLIRDFYCGHIKIFDGNDGTARRLACVLEQNNLIAQSSRRFIKFLVI